MVRRLARVLHTKPGAKNISESRLYRRVRFRSCGTVGYGPTMWVKSRKGGDILHDYDSKAWQRVACQLYVSNIVGTKGEGQREPFSCSLKRGGPLGKVLVHRWLPNVINKSNRVFLTELYTEVFSKVGEYYYLDHIDHKKG